jgi:uncharacterized protein YjbI with pentapeptide repeats
MSNKNHLEILKKGAQKWNSWRRENPEEIPDFSWANLPGMDLKNYNFENANLKLAFCKSCNFTGVNFENSNLYGANLEHTNCTNSNFNGANLEGALIKDAILINSKLSNCNFRLANLEGTNLQGADLSGCKKLKVDQISRAATLYEAKLSERIAAKIIEISPHLFQKSEQ